ncbi:hypothetical protein [Chryseobacterium vrystaatense]|uniref:Uncharacterized protein n=1 Tax=Chryseobacterium vrystaatense TaxID=307480 RepID=A0ABR4USF9_9FLAO|nr:hypothetical protein [Chryseobacterium vrystaatense]KFF28171.1 hypothetical protein IW16_02850 [Chryseobacterium vrystaatense]
MKSKQLWQGADGIDLPPAIKEPAEIITFATYLSPIQQRNIVNAFNGGAYDMAAEYAWKKAIVKLKDTIGTLGMTFIGEMLNRPDIDEYSAIDSVLTDYSTIQLAEQLGVIGKTAALKLRQANELITHYFSKDATEDLDYVEAFDIVKTSVKYILGEQDISIALEFSKFRDRLLTETMPLHDKQLDQVINSPVFYLRTVITILITAIKTEIGAKLENALGNLNTMLPQIWDKLSENDRWNIGSTYRDVTASGNSIAISGVKTALSKVGGFDYVPENLRSNTFIKAAKQLIDVHFAFNNFHNEPMAVKKLATLGRTIPAPALMDCIQAYLVVLLGNHYGRSNAAVPTAENELAKITEERWLKYFEKGITNDDIILEKLKHHDMVGYFSDFLTKYQLDEFSDLPNKIQPLYNAIVNNSASTVRRLSEGFINQIK